MFTEVTVLNPDNTPATSLVTGLVVKRRCISFTPNGDKGFIFVKYLQWEVGLNNTETNIESKQYYIYNVPAVYYVQGEEISPGVIADGTEIKTPAKPLFDEWKSFTITNQVVGLTLEQLFIEMQINQRLKTLPIDVAKMHNNT